MAVQRLLNSIQRFVVTGSAWLLISLVTTAAAAEVADNPRTQPAAALIAKATIEMRSDPEAGRRAAEAAIAKLRTQPDPDLEIRARLLLCDYLSERDTNAARVQLDHISTLLPHAKRHGLASGSFDCRGQMAESEGDHARAREYYDQAVSVAEREQDREMLAAGLFSRGYLLGLQGHYANGLADLRRAQTLFQEVNLPLHALTTLNGVAILYNRMGDYEQARHIYGRALKAQRDAGLRREQAVTLYNLGRVHQNLKDWNAAEQAFAESVRVARDLGYARAEAYSLHGVADIANARGEPLIALAKLESAVQLQRATPDARLRAQMQLVRGEALRQLRRYNEAIRELNAAQEFFGAIDSLSELRDTQQVLAKTLSESGDWQGAYVHLAEAKRTAELLLRNQIDQRFATLKVEFDTLAKEQENAVLLRENQASQNALALERRARGLNAIVILLIVLLAILLGALAVYQSRAGRQMRQLAMTDELTGLPNRRSVLTRFEPLLQRAGIRACAMLVIDVDHFKTINDKFGHAEGDAALKLLASVLQKTIREPAFKGRLGGEEFVVVLPAATMETACAVAEGIRKQVMALDSLPWLVGRPMTVSIGVAVAHADQDSAGAMLHRADLALYEAKRTGRNRVVTEFTAAEDSDARAAHNHDESRSAEVGSGHSAVVPAVSSSSEGQRAWGAGVT
jgi:diguanylate cyclase (GGDEF)-like protein